MRIDGENGWVEILLRDDEEAFDVRCAVGDFAGRNPHIWIDANEQRAFLSALRDLERERRGEARIAAMSPEEFELSIRVVDLPGHVFVEGMIGRLQSFARRSERHAIKFSFTLDPTRLPKLVFDATTLMTGRLMNWLGGIASPPGAPAIDLQKWTDLIAKHPSLVRFADREGVNPFTKGPMIFRAHPGNAHVVVDGATVGAMTWAEDGPDQIGVEGVAALVEPLAREVASLLGAVYRQDGP